MVSSMSSLSKPHLYRVASMIGACALVQLVQCCCCRFSFWINWRAKTGIGKMFPTPTLNTMDLLAICILQVPGRHPSGAAVVVVVVETETVRKILLRCSTTNSWPPISCELLLLFFCYAVHELLLEECILRIRITVLTSWRDQH